MIAGPRQSGKTTLIRQAMEEWDQPAHYASADDPTLQDPVWIEQQWALAHMKREKGRAVLLVLDEIQKVPHWSSLIKKLWDRDTFDKADVKVVLLGSAPLLIQKGLAESLAGRFETIHVPHWSYQEMREAFGMDLDHYLFFGGYPGSASLMGDFTRWSRYVIDSIIEPTISRDILLLTRVDKPALLRRLFHLGTEYSAQILSFQKMLGQLQDAGNTTTLAHYLDLLSGAGILSGISKYAARKVVQRASSPKLTLHNTALLSAIRGVSFEEARADRDSWGRLVESAVGAHLMNTTRGTNVELCYWRERGAEVDFVLHSGKKLVALEVKSGRKRESLSGMTSFIRLFRPDRSFLIGSDGVPLGEFLSKPADDWLQ